MLRSTAFSLAALAFVACVSDPPPSESDAGSGDASLDATADASANRDAGDAGASDAVDESLLVNGCSPQDFTDNDQTSATSPRLITFPATAAPAQYSPHCMMVKRIQTVTFQGNFAAHPLVGSGGATPNPIDGIAPDGGVATVSFFNSNVYGFKCSVHGEPLMWGAINVVP